MYRKSLAGMDAKIISTSVFYSFYDGNTSFEKYVFAVFDSVIIFGGRLQAHKHYLETVLTVLE